MTRQVRKSATTGAEYRTTIMATNEPGRNEEIRERIVDAAASWPEITVDEERTGTTRFLLAGDEIGHLHPRLADIDYPRPLRTQLLAEGQTAPHHALPNHPTATTYHIESAGDVDQVIRLFRLSYLARVVALQRDEETVTALADIDVRDELGALGFCEEIRSAFETAVAE